MTEEERRRLYGPEKGHYNADEEVYEDTQQPAASATPDYGLRADGTKKGKGWLGEIKLPNGDVATEYSVGVGFDGKETEIPTLVPTLTQEEIAQMRDDIIPNNKPVPDAIMNKAIEHARSRMQAGQSVWADEGTAIATPTAATGTQPAVTPQPAPQETPYERFKREDAEEYQKVLDGQKRLEDYWADRLRRHDADIKAEEEEDARRTQMENRRASMVNAAGLAASLFNLYAVGGLHASNQVYKDHMQDWMRKADMDRKMRRARIDNLRDRQRGVQDKLEGLRAANTQDAYNRWRNQAAADAAAAQKELDRQNAEESAQAKRVADMQTKGFVPDTTSETGFRFDPDLAQEMAFARSTKGVRASGSNGTLIPTIMQPSNAASSGNKQSSSSVRPASATPQSTTQSKPATSQTRQQSSGGAKRSGRGRSTFLPPEYEDYEKGVDLKNSPQGRKKIEPENKTDWSQFKVN